MRTYRISILSKLFVLLLATSFLGCSPKTVVNSKITTHVFNYPVLKGKSNNPVLQIAVISDDSTAINVNAIKLSLGETQKKGLKNIRIFYTGLDSIFNTKSEFGVTATPSSDLVFEASETLNCGKHYFWVSYELSEECELTSKVSAQLDYIKINQNKYTSGQHTGVLDLWLGVAVRQHNQDNVHTYRIPGLSTTKSGTLLGIYDIRRDSGRDLQGDMDIGVSRSTDGGNHWETMRIALDMKEWGDLPEKFNGVSDANILVDNKSGDIYIAGLWMHGVISPKGEWLNGLTADSTAWNHQWRNKGSQPGLGVKQTSQFLITKSTDDGKTWGEPINLTEMCKDPKWWLWAPAPGHGITMRNGTLVIPTQGRDENGLPFSNITYSKDSGKTWKTSNAAYRNTTESMVVELEDGSLMLNMRDNRNRQNKSETNGRAIAITYDMGETWKEHGTSHGALIESVCMASIQQHYYTSESGEQKSILFFSNPNSKYSRIKQTIKVSFDDGNTWPEEYWMELDEGRGAGYSCLTSIDDDHIGILYEGSQAHMTFQKVNINRLKKEK